MSRRLFLYPTISEKFMRQESIKQKSIKFFYSDGKRKKEIILSDRDDLNLIDNLSGWNPKRHNLIVEVEVEILNPSVLYGSHRFVSDSGVAGIALSWNSSSAKKQGVTSHYKVKRSLHTLGVTLRADFEKQEIGSDLIVSPIFFIFEASKKLKMNERHLANIQGQIIGTMSPNSILIEKMANEIIVLNESVDKGPLWRIDVNYTSPYDDSFKESITIFLNTKHPGYKLLDQDSKHYEPILLSEVLASAVTTIFHTFKDENYFFDLEDDVSETSIAYVINYWIRNFAEELDTDGVLPIELENPKSIEKWVRETFDLEGLVGGIGNE